VVSLLSAFSLSLAQRTVALGGGNKKGRLFHQSHFHLAPPDGVPPADGWSATTSEKWLEAMHGSSYLDVPGKPMAEGPEDLQDFNSSVAPVTDTPISDAPVLQNHRIH